MPRHNWSFPSFSKLSFIKSPSPPIQESYTLNAWDSLNDTDRFETDASLSAISSITDRNDIIDLNSFSQCDETENEINYEINNQVNNQINDQVDNQINYQQIANNNTQSGLRDQLQLEWTQRDRKFNQWLKEKPTIQQIRQLNDKLDGNKKYNYDNFQFVWVKLSVPNNNISIHTVNCCWWPAQITLPKTQENTKNDKYIRVALFTSDSLDDQQTIKMKRKLIIPFKHLWTFEHLKIFKYVIQCHVDPLLLTHYNLHSLTSEISLKKRQKRFYTQFKLIIRKINKLYPDLRKHSNNFDNLSNLSPCIHWIGDETANYNKKQVVIVRNDALRILGQPINQKQTDNLRIITKVWWPAIVLKKSVKSPSDTVRVHLIKLNIECEYLRFNVIPINKDWFAANYYSRVTQIDCICKLATQIFVNSHCNYELYDSFKKAMNQIIGNCSFKNNNCYHLKEWKRIKKKCKSEKKEMINECEKIETKTLKKQKRKRKGKKHKKKKKNTKNDDLEQDLSKMYNKALTSMDMKSIIIDSKNNRSLWNFCMNPVSFKSCIRNEFDPVQLSFCLKGKPECLQEERKQVELYHNAMDNLSKTYKLKKNRRTSAKCKEIFAKNLRHRLYIRQNTEICDDILYFQTANPLMIISTNYTLNNKIESNELCSFHYPRILSRSSLIGTKYNKNIWHRKGWFLIWYLRFIRLLQYNMQCKCYDYCIQIISILLPVALREFNSFIHETEFIIKCLLFILKQENKNNTNLNFQAAITNIFDCFHENKHKGWHLSCLIGSDRFIRMNEILDMHKIVHTKQICHKQNKNNCDIQLLNVIIQLLEQKTPKKQTEIGDIDKQITGNKKHRQQESFFKTIISTRSRRRANSAKKRKRSDMEWNHINPNNKKRKTLQIISPLLDDNYAADTEDFYDDNDNDVTMKEIKPKQILIPKANHLNIDNIKWKEIMNNLSHCFELNPLNDCYLFFMCKLLSISHCKDTAIINKVYEHIKTFIKLQSNHPNGYRYLITFLFQYSECESIQQIFDHFIQIIHIDPLSICIKAGLKQIAMNDTYICDKLQFIYIKLLSIMNIIEIGRNCLHASKWKKLKNACKEIQSFTHNNKRMDVYDNILSLISEKNEYWNFIYFNSKIFNNIHSKHTNVKILSLKLQCCCMLYGDTHPFIHKFILKYEAMHIKPTQFESTLNVIKQQQNVKCILDVCISNSLKSKKCLNLNKESNIKFLHYGKLCVFEPVICCTPYYLRYSVYCTNFMEWYKSGKNMADVDVDDNKGMNCDCCTPWNDKYKYQLSKYKTSVLQQFHYELRSLYLMFYKPLRNNTYSNPKSKRKIIDSCWTLMKKLKRMNHFVSSIKLVENEDFVIFNENVCTVFEI